MPMVTSLGSTSTSCAEIIRPSEVLIIATTYGFCLSLHAGASWTTEKVYTSPSLDTA